MLERRNVEMVHLRLRGFGNTYITHAEAKIGLMVN